MQNLFCIFLFSLASILYFRYDEYMMKKIFSLSLSVIALLAVDMVSKYILYDLQRWASWWLIEPVLNKGISFSRGVPYRIVIPLTLIACVVFVWLIMKRHISDIVFVLLMAGTLGNGIDRILFDGVRDFIVVPHLFVCNIADIFLSIAVVLILWREYKDRRSK